MPPLEEVTPLESTLEPYSNPVERYAPAGPPDESLFPQRREPGEDWINRFGPTFRSGVLSKTARRIQAWSVPPVSGFDPNKQDNSGYEEYLEDLLTTQSPEEYRLTRQMIDQQRADDRVLQSGHWGIISNFLLVDLPTGLLDPTNYIPIPIVKGIGLVKSAALSGVSNMALEAGSEVLRAQVDPTFELAQVPFNIGLAGFLGAAFGAPAGVWGSGRARALRNLEMELSEIDSRHQALSVRGQDDGVRIEMGDRPVRQADGTRSTISITEEPAIGLGAYETRTIGGDDYVYVEGKGVISAADIGVDNPRAVSQDIVDEFGTPNRKVETVMRVDEARIKHTFMQDGWRAEIQHYLPLAVKVENVIRSGDDLVNFNVRHALWKRSLPVKPGESPEAHALRAGTEAMKEFRASRMGGRAARAKGIEWAMERLNFSILGRGTRVFYGDNVVFDTMARLTGDNGWALNSADFGFRAPPPILFKAMQHNWRYHQWKSEFDQAWVRYSTGKDVKGVSVLSHNLTAAASAMKTGANRFFTGNRSVMSYHEFSTMVGEAIFRKGEFEINGHMVNEHARKAAQSARRMLQEYEREALSTGLFKDQKFLQREIKKASKDRIRLQHRLLQWLWGETGQPAALSAAVRVNVAGVERIIPGKTHDAAIQKMLDEVGEDRGYDALDGMKADDYGYIAREGYVAPARGPRRPPPPPPPGPAPAGGPPPPAPVDLVPEEAGYIEPEWTEQQLVQMEEEAGLLQPGLPTADSPYVQASGEGTRVRGRTVPTVRPEGRTITGELEELSLSGKAMAADIIDLAEWRRRKELARQNLFGPRSGSEFDPDVEQALVDSAYRKLDSDEPLNRDELDAFLIELQTMPERPDATLVETFRKAEMVWLEANDQEAGLRKPFGLTQEKIERLRAELANKPMEADLFPMWKIDELERMQSGDPNELAEFMSLSEAEQRERFQYDWDQGFWRPADEPYYDYENQQWMNVPDEIDPTLEGLSPEEQKRILEDEYIARQEQLAEDTYGTFGMTEGEIEAAQNEYYAGELEGYDERFAGFRTVGEALDLIRSDDQNAEYAELINLIYEDVKDVGFRVVDFSATDTDAYELLSAIGMHYPIEEEIVVRGRGNWPEPIAGTRPDVIIHEAIHGATNRRIQMAITDRNLGRTNVGTEALADLEGLHRDFLQLLDTDATKTLQTGGAADRIARVEDLRRLVGKDIHELLTYGMASKDVRDWLASLPATKPGFANRLEQVLNAILRLFGIDRADPKIMSQLDRAMQVATRFLETEKPLLAGEIQPGVLGFMEAKAMAAPAEPRYRSVDETIEGRVNSLSRKQREIYDDRAKTLAEHDANIASMQQQLTEITNRPHRFLDADGQPEDYFPRFWNVPKLTAQRERYEALFQGWFERESDGGAKQLAKLAIDSIVKDHAGSAYHRIGSMKSLNERLLEIPNSFQIEHPTYGTIKLSEIMDTDSLTVLETYVRKLGARLEVAKTFGDADLTAEKNKIREYLMKRYWEPQKTDRGRAAAMEKINEQLDWIDLGGRAATGTLRTSDPWRMDNRIARTMMHLTSLSQMGRVLYTAIPELVRPFMVNGMGRTFQSTFAKYFGDLEEIRGTRELHDATGDLLDFTKMRGNARVMENQQGEIAMGGTWFENLIADRIPGFFKLTGLPQETVILKDLTMTAAGHNVMEESQKVAAAVMAGEPPDQRTMFRLAAMGIGVRDALLLARMPTSNYGKLILPDIGKWTGTEARQAREIFMRALTGEAQRAISTPSIADKSTLFEGVWVRKGKVVTVGGKPFESDLLRIPMQFLSYGVGAHNKVLFSALQGRDRSTISGVFWMMMLATLSAYLKEPEYSWKNKSFDEKLMAAWEDAGIGGFWFGDLNKQIEQYTNGKAGIRPALGMDPRYRQKGTEVDGIIEMMGAAPNHFRDVSRAFWDMDLKGSERAQLIRRAIPYNNLIWTGGLTKWLAGEIGGAFEGDRQ